jgi:hypothetical protein
MQRCSGLLLGRLTMGNNAPSSVILTCERCGAKLQMIKTSLRKTRTCVCGATMREKPQPAKEPPK